MSQPCRYQHQSRLPVRERADHPRTPSHLAHFYVLDQDGNLVGTVGLEICAPYGLLRSLAVAQTHRGRGLGVELVQRLENYARTCDIQALYLLTTTADMYFSKLGYVVVERQEAPNSLQETTEFKSICPDSAVCMTKRIENE